MSDSDLELLARYTRHGAEDAFAELVRRHLGLVHSAALRQVCSPQLAEEVAQSTFLKLAQHARQLAPDTILSAWLYQVTRREAIDVVRREARRQLREQIATEMNAMNATTADWTHIEPLLDEAMHALDETDRAAVLLRYFENKSLREVGQALGASENAAQKRLTRAVERLREFFARRGATVGTSSLIAVISANAILAAPTGLAAASSTAAALGGTALTTAGPAAAVKATAMTTLQKTFIGAALVMAMMAGCGLPGFANFAGEVLVLFGAWKSLPWFVVLAAWGALVIGAVYMLRAIRDVLHGPMSEEWAAVPDASLWRKVPFALLLASLLAFGFFPGLLTEKIRPSLEPIVSQATAKPLKTAEASRSPAISKAR